MLHSELLIAIAALCGLWGALMLLAPRSIAEIERVLNSEWGGREVFSLRLGLPAEQRAEALLNRPVGASGVRWDGWVQRRPRQAGLLLIGAAVLLVVLAR